MAASPHLTAVLVSLLCFLPSTGAVDECPPWFTLDNSSQCVCSDVMEYDIMCDQKQRRSFLYLGSCAFQDTMTNDTVLCGCPYVFPYHLIVDEAIIPLPNKSSELNEFICGNLNRSIGTHLCGRCINGTGPSVYSYGSQCVSCSAVNIVYYLLLQYLPTTILFVAIVVLRLNITTAPMAFYVLYCNGLTMCTKISSIGTAFLHTTSIFSSAVRVVSVLNMVWSFDPFYFLSPPLCIYEHIEEIYMPFLDTVATLYPFLLLLLTYIGIELHSHGFKPVVCLWRPIHKTYVKFRRTWDPNASVIQAFATLFFLSYTKLVILMYEALVMSVVTNEKGEVVARVTYIDPTVVFFSHKHFYLIFLSVFILIFFILPPLFLLIVFPTCLFKKVSRCLRPRWIVSIQTFVDTFYSCYKDGTNGTRDYRAVSGYILAVFAFFPTVQITTLAVIGMDTIFLAIVPLMFFITLTAIFALLEPYKDNVANNSGVAFFTIYAFVTALYASFYGYNSSQTTVVILIALLVNLPHCVFYGYILHRLVKVLRQYCCRKREMEDSLATVNSLRFPLRDSITDT